jgi:cellulose synthase/poly-beta-1,6-N-acetylglucosamine synthase-like glycosyltransferase
MSIPTLKGEKILTRAFEIVPVLLSWTLLTSPFWASFIAPVAVAYFIIFFDIYFFYRAALLGINALRGYFKIRKTTKPNWFQKLEQGGLPWQKMRHIVFIPTYKEPLEILERTLTFLAESEFPTEQINICLATEKREEEVSAKANALKDKFGPKFGHFWITHHELGEGEVAGKSSNLAYAGREIKKVIEDEGYEKDSITVTSCDADVCLHPKYFSVLAYKFLTSTRPYNKFWQAAILFYNNIWRVPMLVRVVHTIYSINGVAQLMTPGSNFNYSTYSTSWRLLEKADFWDVDVIPEDWHLFFKAFFAHGGEVELESIYLPLYADAVEGQSYWESLKAQYFQNRRWAWGVTDIAYAVTGFLKNRGKISPVNFIVRFVRAAEQHLLWPVNWWILTLGAALPPLLNPSFRYTTLGFNLPRVSGFILSLCIVFFVLVIIVDLLMKPPRPEYFKKGLLPLNIAQYILLPIASFFFSALPGMDAHTRLLLGKRLEYKVTEKIVKT